MSTISSALTSSAAAQTASATKGSNGFSELTSDEFIKVMLTELTNQDPFEPNDSKALLEQMSSLRNIESQSALQESLEALVMQNSVAQAGGMIGKKVEGITLDNKTVSGLVKSVRVSNGVAQLELDNGYSLPIDRVTLITEKSAA